MLSPRTDVIARRSLDALIGGVCLLAVYVAIQPGSLLHARWARYRSQGAVDAAIARHWPQLVSRSSPLYASLPATDPPREGGEVIEISDYECPYCRATNPAVDSAVAAGVKVRYLHLPGPTHRNAEAAARAAMCAERVGRFRALHARLMGTDAWQADADWAREARAAGIADVPALVRCMGDDTTTAQLAAHRALADSLRVSGTPTFVSRTGNRVGVVTTAELVALAGARRE